MNTLIKIFDTLKNGSIKTGASAAILIAAAICLLFFKQPQSIQPETNNQELKKTILLDGNNWSLTFWKQPKSAVRTLEGVSKIGNKTTIPAKVPSNAETELFSAGLIDDLHIGTNIFKFRKFEGHQWMYSRKFPTPQIQKNARAVIRFEGVDTLADIFVNSHKIGSTENMFIAHSFDITDILKTNGEENTLDVIFRSPVIESKKYPAVAGQIRNTRTESSHIRKAQATFGWDIHPRLISSGLWRSVAIDIIPEVSIEDAFWFTMNLDEKKKTASVSAEIKIDAPFEKIDSLTAEATLSLDGKKIASSKSRLVSYQASFDLWVNNAKFWWPRSYGEPTLYDAEVRITDEAGKLLAIDKRKVGIRTTHLEFEEIPISKELKPRDDGATIASKTTNKVGGKFQIYVNNTPIFVKGTNWVPLDASHSKDKQHLKSVIDMAVDLNCNMIRCWGGNVYEDTDFFELCDKEGIMVWQDFALACNVYPQGTEFANKIEKEVSAVVRKLRSHPSLVIWAGNNENDQAFKWRNKIFEITPELDRISRVVIPNAIRDADWTRPYLPSSPYLSSKTTSRSARFAAPEVHLWGPRGYYKVPFYKNAIAHFVSEIGYHGCPNRESLEKMMTKDKLYPWKKWTTNDKLVWNEEWQAKAVMSFPESQTKELSTRNDIMLNQMKILFGEIPEGLDDFIFASQSIQAEAKKYFIELWRSQKFATKTGIIWWNLRDAWPIVSDAITDYYNSKKLAYYYIKRVQTDVCVMVNDAFEVSVANDTMKPAKVSVRIYDVDTKTEVFKKESSVNANASAVIGKIKPMENQGMLIIEYTIDEGKKQLNHYLYGKAPFKLKDYKRWYKKLDISRD